jgi:hypothetical protein
VQVIRVNGKVLFESVFIKNIFLDMLIFLGFKARCLTCVHALKVNEITGESEKHLCGLKGET